MKALSILHYEYKLAHSDSPAYFNILPQGVESRCLDKQLCFLALHTSKISFTVQIIIILSHVIIYVNTVLSCCMFREKKTQDHYAQSLSFMLIYYCNLFIDLSNFATI